MRPLFTAVLGLGAAAAGCAFDAPAPLDNEAPVVSGISAEPLLIGAGTTALVTVSVTDPESQELAFEWSANGGTLVSATGPGVSWTAPAEPGGYRIDVRVTDAAGLSDEARLFVAVAVLPEPESGNLHDPVVTLSVSDTVVSVTGDTAETITVTAAATDEDGDLLSYEWLMGIGEGDAEGPDTTWSPVPGLCCEQPYPIGVVVSDGRGRSAFESIDVMVDLM